MFEDIQKHRQAVRENIEKSLQIGFTESEDFEKAHKVGDIHPNGKWVWTQLPSGKFDWRVIKVKPQANTGGGSGIMGKTVPKSAVQNNPSLSAKQQAIQKQMATQSQKTTPKKNPAELKTISEVEDYAKSISGVTFKSVKSGWDDKGAKAFELTYPHGGKLVIDFLNNEEYVYELTDSNDKTIISTNSTDEISHTDWSIRLNPDKLVSRRVEVLKTKVTKLKGEETKARNKMIRDYSSFSDKYAYQKASEAVSDMKTKIQKLQSLIGTF